jgi:predicted DNA-binding transcriptional regulator AlpA
MQPSPPTQPARGPRIPYDRLWTVHDVSYFLGVPVATLYQWRCTGRGPASRRIGRYLRYRPADVLAWVDDPESGIA